MNAFATSFSDHYNSFRMQNVLELSRTGMNDVDIKRDN